MRVKQTLAFTLALTLVGLPLVAKKSTSHKRSVTIRSHVNNVRSNSVGRKTTFIVTAYCLRGHTKAGTHARKGIVAVDQKVIPLGSRVYVPGYGWARAEDTGGKIRGRRLDIWLPSRHLCSRWGRKEVTIQYLQKYHRKK